MYTYTLLVPERAGPGPADPNSIVWLYHSHVEEQKDVDSGLIGAIIVTRRGMANPDGTPKDADREVVTLFNIFDENQSWYLDRNIQKYALDPKGAQKGEAIPVDPDGDFSLNGTGFADSNIKFTINGYIYGNEPTIFIKKVSVFAGISWRSASVSTSTRLTGTGTPCCKRISEPT